MGWSVAKVSGLFFYSSRSTALQYNAMMTACALLAKLSTYAKFAKQMWRAEIHSVRYSFAFVFAVSWKFGGPRKSNIRHGERSEFYWSRILRGHLRLKGIYRYFLFTSWRPRRWKLSFICFTTTEWDVLFRWAAHFTRLFRFLYFQIYWVVGRKINLAFSGKYKGQRLVEVGSAASIHCVISACAHFDQIIMSDFAESNRQELSRWLRKEPGCFDWGPVIRQVGQMESGR